MSSAGAEWVSAPGGDEVDARGGDLGHALQRDIARRPGERPPGGQFNSGAHVRGAHVIQQKEVGTCARCAYRTRPSE